MIQSTATRALIDPDSKSALQKQRLKQVCEQFEALLTKQLLQSMRQSIMRAEQPKQEQEIYENMLDDSLAMELSKHENGGLATLLYNQFLPLISKRSGEGSLDGSA